MLSDACHWRSSETTQSCCETPGGNNDQNNSVCFVRVGARFRRTSNAVLASLSGRRHDHASPYGLRRRYGHGQRCLRGQNHHAPCAPLCAMEWWRLRSLLLSVLLTAKAVSRKTAERRAIMSRFLIPMFVGATIAAAVSTSASAWHCLASSPNGAAGTAFGVMLERAQSISMRRCIHRGGGTGCQIAWCRPY